MKIVILLLGLVFIYGCATMAEYGEVVDGKRIPKEYIKIKGGAGEAEFPSGHKIKAEPPIKLPDVDLSGMEIEK